MQVEVLVEVLESENFYDMIEQAEGRLDELIRPSTGFMPYRKTPNMVQDNTTVQELIQRLTVQPGTGWFDK